MDDNELIQKCIQGDIKAFDKLVYKYRDRIYGIAFHLLKDREMAEDVAQETFLRAFQNLKFFDQNMGTFSNWLTVLAVRLCFNAMKKRSYEGKMRVYLDDFHLDECQLNSCSENSENLEELWLAEERRKMVREFLESLPITHRAALLLRYGENMGVNEIAETLKVPVGTVKAWLFRGRETLRRKLKEAGMI